jgi:hypothetical protein
MSRDKRVSATALIEASGPTVTTGELMMSLTLMSASSVTSERYEVDA